MDIEGLGKETVILLYENHLISNIADLYNFQRNELLNLERMADKSVDNLLMVLRLPRIKPLRKYFWFGNKIRRRNCCQKVRKAFFQLINQGTSEELIELDEIGDRIADSLLDYFKDERNFC